MEYLPRTYSVLSVAAVEKFHTSLRELLPGGRYAPVQFAYDAADARRRLLENRYDIIIISAPLRDEFGTHLAQHFAEQSGAGILLLVKPEYYSDVSAQVTPCGVLTLQKPTSPQMMLQCTELLCGTRERLRRMEQKSLSMEDKMAEIRLINRAKWVLIEQGMSEQDAHRYIEKQAMDRCVPKRVVAEEILR
ncbi:MAG: ANTAR domain-containing protein [Clostridiales bacterium]|nr:ANTAR domain-containing protein [Clostridiales bacterium]